MRTQPSSWLNHAEQTKTKINSIESQERRDQVVYLAYLIARARHRYGGTLGDWEFVINEPTSQHQRPCRK